MTFEPRGLATAIGSLPHLDAGAAVQCVLTGVPGAPCWPQLPGVSFEERMDVQFSEGVPRVAVDRTHRRIHINTSGETARELGAFHARAAARELDAFAITPGFAKGLYAMETALAAKGAMGQFVKVQATGPVTFGLTVRDESGRNIYYNSEFMDAIVKSTAMKCRWQIRRFAKFARRVICFVDEPMLALFGSLVYANVTRHDVVEKLTAVIAAVHAEGAIAGVHCCGPTEWPMLIEAGADVLSFDAFNHGETISLYPEAMRRHLLAGGALAWGIVPTDSGKVRLQTPASLAARLHSRMERLAAATGLDRDLILRQALITPSCGAGSLSVTDAGLVFRRLRETAGLLYGSEGGEQREEHS